MGASALKGDLRRPELKRQGFKDWTTFAGLADQLSSIPRIGGVYVVTQPAEARPDFIAVNPGGRFKGQDPSVGADALSSNWADGAEVVYIGKADDLRRRLREFMHFGAGAPIGHWGGRLIWQLARSAELLVAWRETPGQVPKEVEGQMIGKFRKEYGKPPFANEPRRLGR